jgi:hypothetical protein
VVAGSAAAFGKQARGTGLPFEHEIVDRAVLSLKRDAGTSFLIE